MEGRFSEAERYASEALDLARAGGHRGAEMVYEILVAVCRLETGAEPLPRAARPTFPSGDPILMCYPVWEAAAEGRLDEAEALCDRALAAVPTAGEDHNMLISALCRLTDALVMMDRPQGAEAIHARLLPYAEWLDVTGGGEAVCMGSVAHHLGLLETLMEDFDRAEEHFRYALRRNLEVGAAPYAAYSRWAWAAMLRRRGRAGDLRRAAELARAAATDALRLGMRPLLARADSLLAELQRAGATTLSPREREVADLVRGGLSNRDIATRLHLSERTAENHVKNIMDKLGLSNRTQVATWVTEIQGLPKSV
jgi:DNA-binding CsgD family transcriptional regulator